MRTVLLLVTLVVITVASKSDHQKPKLTAAEQVERHRRIARAELDEDEDKGFKNLHSSEHDSDGEVGERRGKVGEAVQHHFDRLDTNHDGKLEFTEVRPTGSSSHRV